MFQLADLRKVSCLPTFLLSIVGNCLYVSGAIFLDGVVTEHLMECIWLRCRPDHLEKDLSRITHVLMALRECLDDLDNYYKDIAADTSSPIAQSALRPPGPHLHSLNSGEIELTYTDRLLEVHHPRSIFMATARFPKKEKEDQSTGSKKCIVKFTERYSAEAHELMESIGVAAPLLHCEFEPSVGMFCVVTEYIHETEGTKISVQGATMLRQALQSLHNSGLVFGDLRSPNVILDSEGWPYLIDFDWSGKEGEMRYPVNLNMDDKMIWADGILSYALITKEHDLAMLNKYLAEVGVASAARTCIPGLV